MTVASDINIIISGGSAIKEVHNTRKQSSDLNQQFVVQDVETIKEEEKEKIAKANTKNRIEMGKEKDKKRNGERNKQKPDSDKKASKEKTTSQSKHLIDIMV